MDAEYIRESYAQMPDEELIKLVKFEANSLTGEARAVLQEELSKRNLGNSFEEALVKNVENERKRKEASAQKKAEEEFVQSVLGYVFEARYNGLLHVGQLGGEVLGLDRDGGEEVGERAVGGNTKPVLHPLRAVAAAQGGVALGADTGEAAVVDAALEDDAGELLL